MSDPEGEGREREDPPLENDAPSGSLWLDLEYIQASLREGLKDQNITIVSYEVLPATLKGENYASVVYKCRATDTLEREYLTIIKCLPSNALRQKFSNSAQIFRKEVDMYTVIFPDYKDMLLDRGMDTFWPRYYCSTIDGLKDTIVLEDERPHGYVMRERRKGLNRDHLEVVLAALARHHACSVAMKLRGPEVFERKVVALFPEMLFTSDQPDMNMWAQICIDSGSKVIREWGGDKYTRIADKVVEMRPTYFAEVVDDLQPKEGALLTHGDFWMNNMLFRYATREEAETGSGKPVKVMLLDFQMARYSSPAIDLLYLMVTSVDTETRRKHWKRLLEHAYLESFWKDLESLGHKGDVGDGLYTLEWLESEMREHMMFAFFTAISVMKAVMAPTEDAPDLDSMTEESMKKEMTDPFSNLAKDDVFQERFRGIIDDFEETGFFE